MSSESLCMAWSSGLTCPFSCSSCSADASTGPSLYSVSAGVLFSLVPALLSFARRNLEQRRWRRRLGCIPGGLSSTGSSLSLSLGLLGVSTMYTSYKEVVVQHLVNCGFWHAPYLHRRPYRRCLRSRNRAC